MNKKEKEAALKRVKAKAKATKIMNKIRSSTENVEITSSIVSGDVVKLNYELITSRKDYHKRTELYKSFVENNRDKEFIADVKDSGLVSLQGGKWWFFWEGDLRKVKQELTDEN